MLNVLSQLRRQAQGNFIDELREGVDYGPEAEEEYGLPWEDFIEDNIDVEEEPTETPFPPEAPDLQPVDIEGPRPDEAETSGYQQGDVDFFNGEELPVIDSYDDVNALIKDSVLKHVIKIDYTTRFGVFTPDRIVEPHRTFTAGTGNQILLTYDRTVNDIRGFIIGNIKPGAVLYENAFDVKPEIMRPRPQRRPIMKGTEPKRQVSKRR